MQCGCFMPMGLFLLTLLVVSGKVSLASSAADAVARLQHTSEKQRQSLLEEEAKKEAAFAYYGTMSTDHSTRLLAAFRARYPFLQIIGPDQRRY
jgi:hypothetical protein